MSVAIQGNVIFSNSINIDLSAVADLFNGVTPNDPAPDADSGANFLQNFPEITNAVQGSTHVSGRLISSNATTYRVEFFATDIPQGGAFLGATNLTTALGTAPFSLVWSYALPSGALVHATATDPNGNTSEFSPGATNQPAIDTDGDGIPDAWEIAYFGGPTNANATSDGDLDGQNNLSEFITDTIPNNGASLFKLSGIDRSVPDTLVQVQPSPPGRFHQLEFTTNLLSGTNWTSVGTSLAGDGGLLALPDPSADARRSYRVRVRMP